MKFQYHNPIKFIFGEDAFEQIGTICKDHKVMLVYGGGSIKANGVYDSITKILKSNGIRYIDYGNHTGSADYQRILDGILLAEKEQIDTVIGIGGASAMDTGKAIAFGAVHENLEDYIEGRKEADGRHLLNIVIPTYPSTGSEANGICDIMEYKGYGTELFGAWPDYCLMNPSVTMSLDLKNTAYSVMGCFIQTASWYIGNHQNDIAKGFSKTVLKVLLESMERLSEDLHDTRARSNIMWASCVNTMGVFRSGVDHPYPWTVFSVSYIPRAAHHVSYRKALVTAYPVWLKGIAQYHMEDIRMLFTEIFGIDDGMDNQALITAGCDKIRELMEKSGIPLTLSAYGECPSKEFIQNNLEEGDFGEFSLDEMYDMIAECYQ